MEKFTTFKKYVIKGLLAVLLVNLFLTSGIANEQDAKTLKIGYITISIESIFLGAGRWAMQNEIKKLEKEGYTIEWYIESSMEPMVQLSAAETMVNIPVDFVVIEPIDSHMTRIITIFEEAGIPVICKNADIIEGPFHPYVSMGNFDAAVQAGNALIELCEKLYGPTPEDWVKNGGKDGRAVIVNLAGKLSQTNAMERYDGFLSVWQPIADNTPGLEIVSKPFDWLQEKAYTIAQDMWTLYGDSLLAFFAASDDALTSGVIPSLKAEGVFKKVGDPQHIPLVGIDGNSEALRAIRRNELDITIMQDSFGEGRVCALVLKKLLKGEPLDKVGTVLWEGIKPLVIEVMPKEFGPEYDDVVEPWAPVTVVEAPSGVQYKTNTGVCTAWGFGFSADSKVLWGNVMEFLEYGEWPWERGD